MGLKIGEFKRTKIVCTLGPSTDDLRVLKEMIEAGMNVARLNLSHGTLDEHIERMAKVRNVAAELGTQVALMFDTRGPDVRIGDLESKNFILPVGHELVLDENTETGSAERVGVTHPELLELLKVGDSVFLNDGHMELRVVKCGKGSATCEVVTGGLLKPRKGINIPGKAIPLPVLTDEDIHDLREGIKFGIDYISASFVDSPEDIYFIRGAIGGKDVGIIAKIESAEGVSNLDSIIAAADGIMVARGDLGIEIPPEEVPGVQKRMIRLCREARKPVITATEMLESMTRSPRPTRAEITDVANAVLDGTSAVMLSAETAVGQFPVKVVEMMSRICVRAESDIPAIPLELSVIKNSDGGGSVRDGIAHAAIELASDIDAPAIICVTDSGTTAAIFSHLRPSRPVLACTPDERVAQRLSLYWGVLPVVVDENDDVNGLLEQGIAAGRARGIINTGDRIVFTGNLSGHRGETNLLATVEVTEK